MAQASMTGISSPHTPADDERNEQTVSDFTLAAIILAAVLICILLVVGVCSCYRRRLVTQNDWLSMLCSCLCPCRMASSRQRRADLTMGYIPANITVNSAALEQGIPDIFNREGSQGGNCRISLEPYSFDTSSSKVQDSPTAETSGAWYEYLRRATTIRRGPREGADSEDHGPVADTSSPHGKSQGARQDSSTDLQGITNPIADKSVGDDSTTCKEQYTCG